MDPARDFCGCGFGLATNDESVAGTGPADGADQAPTDLWKLLSNREVDVLELLANRLTNKIADRLHISPETVPATPE